MYRALHNLDESALRAKGEALEQKLQSTEYSEQQKQESLAEYLTLLQSQRAAALGIEFCQRLFTRVSAAFHAHLTTDLAVDMLYACILVQQFYAMDFAPWRAHTAIEDSKDALKAVAADGRDSDCLRYCQAVAELYAEAKFWPEALTYAVQMHDAASRLLQKGITRLENGARLDLRDTACAVCLYASQTADGLTEELMQKLTVELGAEEFAAVVKEAAETVGDTVIDPVELTPEYLAIRYELEEKIDEALEHQRGYYDYCKEYWMVKKLILRSDYGIAWKSPAVLNPGVEFH